jgi:hypothetical protein
MLPGGLFVVRNTRRFGHVGFAAPITKRTALEGAMEPRPTADGDPSAAALPCVAFCPCAARRWRALPRAPQQVGRHVKVIRDAFGADA